MLTRFYSPLVKYLPTVSRTSHPSFTDLRVATKIFNAWQDFLVETSRTSPYSLAKYVGGAIGGEFLP